MFGVDMKRMFGILLLGVMACCIATSYGVEAEPQEKVVGKSEVQKEITEQCLEKLAEQLIGETSYDTELSQFMGNADYKNAVMETIKSALREKVYTTTGAEKLGDIFDETIGSEDTENYLIIRFLCKYMLKQGDSLETAIQHLYKIFDQRIRTATTFAKSANIEKLLKMNTTELVEKLEALIPDEPLKSAKMATNGAKDIFEFIKMHIGNIEDYEKACDDLLTKMPVYGKTDILNTSGNTVNTIVSERLKGNAPVAINWRYSTANAGTLQTYVPGLLESLNNASTQAKKSACLLSKDLKITVQKDGKETVHAVDVISSNVNTTILADIKSMKEIARLQCLIAILSGHNSLVVDMTGLNLTSDRLEAISKIYAKESANPLIKGKLKNVLFITSK